MQKNNKSVVIIKLCLIGWLFFVFGCSTDQYDYMNHKYQDQAFLKEPEEIKVKILLKDTRKHEKPSKKAIENAPNTNMPLANSSYAQNGMSLINNRYPQSIYAKNGMPTANNGHPQSNYGQNAMPLMGNNGLNIKRNRLAGNNYAKNSGPMMSNNAFNIKTNVYAQNGYGNNGYRGGYNNYLGSNNNIPAQCLGGAQVQQLPICAQYFAGDPLGADPAAGLVGSGIGALDPGIDASGFAGIDPGGIGGPGFAGIDPGIGAPGFGGIDPGIGGPGFAGIDPGLYGGIPPLGAGLAPGIPYPGLEFGFPGFPIIDDLLWWEDDGYFGDYGYGHFDDDDDDGHRKCKHKKRCCKCKKKKNHCKCKKKKHHKKHDDH